MVISKIYSLFFLWRRLTEAWAKYLDAFELLLYRRLWGISCARHVTNKEELRRVDKGKEVIITIKSKTLKYISSIYWKTSNLVVYYNWYCYVEYCVRKDLAAADGRISWLKNLQSCFSVKATSVFKLAVNKRMIADLIANIRIK